MQKYIKYSKTQLFVNWSLRNDDLLQATLVNHTSKPSILHPASHILLKHSPSTRSHKHHKEIQENVEWVINSHLNSEKNPRNIQTMTHSREMESLVELAKQLFE